MRDASNPGWDRSRIPAILGTYFRLLALPWPLGAYYTVDEVRLTAPTLAGALILVLSCILLGRRSTSRAGLVALVWILAFLAPVLGLVPIGGAVVAERFLYLPSVGLSLLVSLAPLPALSGDRLRSLAGATAALVLVLALCAAATLARSSVWKDEVTLFSDIVRKCPSYAEAYNNLGAALGESGRNEEALVWLNRALERMPGSATVQNSLGAGYGNMGRTGEEIDHFRLAVELQPS